MLIRSEPSLDGALDKNSIRPMFETLAGCCLSEDKENVIAMIAPTIIAAAPSAAEMRQWMAARFHLHTILTSFASRDGNLSQSTEINESIFVFRQCDGPHPPTRIVALDRFPSDEQEAETLHSYLRSTQAGILPDGWGEVSSWPAEAAVAGDWTAAVWRAPRLAAAASAFARHADLAALHANGGGGGYPQDQPDPQRQIPQNDRSDRQGRVRVHATLQSLYSGHRMAPPPLEDGGE